MAAYVVFDVDVRNAEHYQDFMREQCQPNIMETLVNRKTIPLIPVVAILLGCQTTAPSSTPRGPEFLVAPQAAALSLPFSEAVRAGDFLILSGQVGNVPGTTGLAPGGMEPETKQALNNMKAILERHGATVDDIVKCTVFLADIREWPAFNVIYRTYFPNHFPARSALAASGLAFGARVEVECMAYKPMAQP